MAGSGSAAAPDLGSVSLRCLQAANIKGLQPWLQSLLAPMSPCLSAAADTVQCSHWPSVTSCDHPLVQSSSNSAELLPAALLRLVVLTVLTVPTMRPSAKRMWCTHAVARCLEHPIRPSK